MDLRLRTRPSAGYPSAADALRASAIVVEVAGEIDLHCAPQLRAELGRAIEQNTPPRVVVDLGGVSFLDSTGVGVLVGALKRAREMGGALHFCGAQSRVKRVFEITGLIGALPLFATRDEALTAFETPDVESAETGAQAAVAQPAVAQPAVAQAAVAQPALEGSVISAGEYQ